MKKLKQELINKNIITAKNKVNPKVNHILSTNPSIKDKLQESFKHYSGPHDDFTLMIRLLILNLDDIPSCKNVGCSNKTKFQPNIRNFKQYCSHVCAWTDPANVARVKATKKQRYNDSSYNNRNKAKKTCMERYGVVHHMKDEEISNRIKRAYQNNNMDDITARRRMTIIAKYGTPTFAQHVQQTENPIAYKVLNNKDLLQEKLKDLSKTEIAMELGVPFGSVHAACGRHGIDYIPQTNRSISAQEKQLLKSLQDKMGAKFPVFETNVTNQIPPYELDIFFPNEKIAIEYHGIFWHSELKGKDKHYHLTKHQRCDELGIHLIQVWSNEWETNPDLVISRIVHKLSGTKNTIYARRCEIVKLDTDAERNFFNTNHVQGYAPSSFCYGLVYEDEVVAAMSFSKSRFSKQYDYELLRYSVKMYTSVVGGANRLFKKFTRECNPKRLVTYSNKRWNRGGVYSMLGFEYKSTSSPNYFYFFANGNTNNLMSRLRFQKHKLEDKLDVFNPHLTEWENMQLNGYDRIWDCGNDVYVWTND